MNQTQRELSYYKALKNAQTGQIRILEAANKKLIEIIKEMEGEEPRFLLDKDSICYGCPEYKRITDCDLTDPWNHWGEGDGHGGVCDTQEPCHEGSRNTYKAAKMMEAEIKIEGLEKLKSAAKEVNETAADLIEKMERLKSATVSAEVEFI